MLIMKTLSFGAFGAALNKRRVCLCILGLIIVTLWNTHSVTAAPAKLDSLDSTFPLDFQPPVFEATASANGGKTTIDSYGNPIESLQPINTPDGRKVVSAQGLQFEIPNYASGITELNKPAGALLPPFIGEFNKDFHIATSAKYSGQANDNKPGIRIINKDSARADEEGLEHVNTFVANDAYVSGQLQDIRRYKRQLQFNTHTYNNNSNNNNNNKYNNNSNNDNLNAQTKHEIFSTQNTNTNTNKLNVANTTTTDSNNKRLDGELTTNTLSSNLENSFLNLFANNLNSRTNISSLSSSSALAFSFRQYNNSFQSPSSSSKTQLSAHYNNPLSNGNFNYPNLPTDASIVERIFSKYENPLPTLDPIVVALPDTSAESFSTNPDPHASDDTTSVDVESVPLVEFKSQLTTTHGALVSLSKGLPDYILELNDPDIGGPVDYVPSDDKRSLNIIAWDLLPPLQAEEGVIKSVSHNNNKVSASTGHNIIAQASQESSHNTPRSQLGLTTSNPNYTQHRGGVSYSTSTTTPRAVTTTSRRTTTTARTTTTPRTTKTTTTTTRRTTTPRTTTTRTTTTTPAPDPAEFFKLAAGDSYTLPPWLLDIDDPDLDVAVTFEIPEDINEYNHTIDRDLLPPLEPYTDLNNIHLTQPQNHNEATTTARTTTSTTTPTTTTRRPTTTTIKPHWIRAKPTSPKPTVATFNHQFTSFSPFSSSTNFAQRTTSTTTTSTVKPITSTNFHNRQLSSNTPQTDKIDDNSSREENANNKNSRNPFLSKFDDGKYKPQTTTSRTTTTSTTTTTTPAPEIIEKNPFEATIPPWLKDFDYPNLGPGVPFIYDPNEDENPVDENILPPSEIEENNAKTNPSPNTSPFLNSQTPQGFTNKFTSSALPSILSSSSTSSNPSIVTNPLPSIQTNQAVSTFTQPPVAFVPTTPIPALGNTNAVKSDGFSKHTSSTINKHFAAPFDPATSSNSANAVTGGDQKKIPLSADRESFPPYNNIATGSSTIPSKTTFSKSEDGKVITNNIFLNAGSGSATSAGPNLGSRQPVTSQEQYTLTTPSAFGTGLTTSYSATGFVTSSSSSSSSLSSSSTVGSSFTTDGSRYTGRFGGPPGVLSPQGTGFTASSSAVTKTYNKPTGFGITLAPGRNTNNNDRFSGSFGGPPGILRPYDNVQNR